MKFTKVWHSFSECDLSYPGACILLSHLEGSLVPCENCRSFKICKIDWNHGLFALRMAWIYHLVNIALVCSKWPGVAAIEVCRQACQEEPQCAFLTYFAANRCCGWVKIADLSHGSTEVHLNQLLHFWWHFIFGDTIFFVAQFPLLWDLLPILCLWWGFGMHWMCHWVQHMWGKT